MPWAANVKGILESWYPASVAARPSPTFSSPRQSLRQLPSPLPPLRPTCLIPGHRPHPANRQQRRRRRRRRNQARNFPVDYNVEGMASLPLVPREKQAAALRFGFGLSYTHFVYSDLGFMRSATIYVTFTLRNTGAQAGDEIAQVYVTLPASAGEPFRKLAGWKPSPSHPAHPRPSPSPRPALSLHLLPHR